MLNPMLLLLVAAIVAVLASVRRIPEGHAYTLRRVGGHTRTVGSGMRIVLPVLERVAHRIRLLGNVVHVDALPATQTGARYSGQVYYQVLDARRADAVIDHVDELVRECLPSLLGATADEDAASCNARIKAALNSRLGDRGILVTRVQVSSG
jgi:regulator of protease activity HflC (stomatin/prohibitin superfamily)